jgi:hypothetical protein
MHAKVVSFIVLINGFNNLFAPAQFVPVEASLGLEASRGHQFMQNIDMAPAFPQ